MWYRRNRRQNPEITVPLGITASDEFEDEDLRDYLEDAQVVVETEIPSHPDAILVYEIWGPARDFDNDFEYESRPFAKLYGQRRTLAGAIEELREIFASLDEIDLQREGCCPVIFTYDDDIKGPLKGKYTQEEFLEDQRALGRLRAFGRKLNLKPVIYNWKIRGAWVR